MKMNDAPERVCLVLGTNMGDRPRNLRAAISVLVTELANCLCSQIDESEVMETEPWGFECETPFLNQAISFDTTCPPELLLEVCQYVERKMGRPAHEEEYDAEGKRIYHPRIIDIDIVLYGNRKIDLPQLKIPHPQLEERDYVKKLIAQIKV